MDVKTQNVGNTIQPPLKALKTSELKQWSPKFKMGLLSVEKNNNLLHTVCIFIFICICICICMCICMYICICICICICMCICICICICMYICIYVYVYVYVHVYVYVNVYAYVHQYWWRYLSKRLHWRKVYICLVLYIFYILRECDSELILYKYKCMYMHMYM